LSCRKLSEISRSRIALETGTHSSRVSQQLSQLGHEVIVAHARNVWLIGRAAEKMISWMLGRWHD